VLHWHPKAPPFATEWLKKCLQDAGPHPSNLWITFHCSNNYPVCRHPKTEMKSKKEFGLEKPPGFVAFNFCREG